ncbi:hypothetical protein EJ05DRAFT_537604 [Pseudovirgaria hyperparasitica]|uniref:Extracellular membrane protein CFEM domain-containing protein n=1 Tax=Pseudovirgaria hyperparasitica TaxID=470096 RepID=A0A6A6WAV4_9PEZI|nr:uncharacterized protein EJ05DRAFT_537604 [Pseudovirgaria hyperparasitica]KAF2759309.1 hypothetical protein EJ05DRAFT_537604 [Pseudovirgaria hyperparasitica]
MKNLILAILATTIVAQSTEKIIPFSSLPACAATCPELNAANDVCVPPAVPAGNTDSYRTCVCNSDRLAALITNPKAVCASVCTTDSDFQAIQSGYNTLCGRNSDTGTNNPGATSANAGAASTNSPSPNSTQNNEDKSWISTHWGWIIFAVVLVVAMVGGGFGGAWLKRRHRRRVDARNANVASTDNVPHQAEMNTSATMPVATAPAMTQVLGNRGMDSGIAPPRRAFTGRSTRSRSSTVTSNHNGTGPVVWGPHQNMAATNDYSNVVPPGTAYSGVHDMPERNYNPTISKSARSSSVYNDVNTAPIPSASPGPPSPVDEVPSPPRHTDGAGAQRIREMRSNESLERRGTPTSVRENLSRTGTPVGGKLRKQ